ncbi:hypothetical protein [Sphingomicrobium aestuariivivum]|uniref:hypothetical protein n=1 Tax=Sphingomicrobium aestuariivivum TaxID=1582356 RepID=UPI001FD6692D|nr:hypothetical protein [Sphingomicrobium aestuariivivum]MCJ8191491.1 hypothetical protein [Sphingomicrobium aestuariivivum]
MSALTIQRLLASVFFLLGGWALFFPDSVIALGVNEPYRSGSYLETLLMACFGAQACIAGTFAWFSRFTKASFIAYGVVLLPFFVFNYWFTIREPVLNSLMLADLAGNVVMLGLCYLGWKKAPRRLVAAD